MGFLFLIRFCKLFVIKGVQQKEKSLYELNIELYVWSIRCTNDIIIRQPFFFTPILKMSNKVNRNSIINTNILMI